MDGQLDNGRNARHTIPYPSKAPFLARAKPQIQGLHATGDNNFPYSD